LSNSTCAISSPQGVSIPDNYRTHAALGFSAIPGDEFSTFDHYDLYVRQTIPFIIASTNERSIAGGRIGRSDTQVVCVAPDTVLPGSRIPEWKFGTWKEENGAAGSANWRIAERFAILVAATVSLGFVVY
jgi:hypothetical protein